MALVSTSSLVYTVVHGEPVEKRRLFAIHFVLGSSGNSSRWKKKTCTDRRKMVEEKGEVESKRVRHEYDHG